MKIFTYIVARDYGFAPNPFRKVCTLSACKPGIRKAAKIGDWIFGTGSIPNNAQGKLIYAMEVNEILTFEQYWNDPRFQFKKPQMNGSIRQMYGDNIYFKDAYGNWKQKDSHHANQDGSINYKNLITDLKGENVLISYNYYYFGRNFINIPQAILNDVCKKKQGFKYVTNSAGLSLINYLKRNYKPGKHGNPIQLTNAFHRYKGNK